MENIGKGIHSAKLKAKAHFKKSFHCWHKVQLAIGIKTTNKKTCSKVLEARSLPESFRNQQIIKTNT